MGHTIAAVAGWCVLLGGAGAIAFVLGRRAAAHGFLLALAVGAVVRLAVLLIAHAGSVSLGDHGILFIDDQTYLHDARLLADLWGQGELPNPSRYNVLGTFQYGYQLLLGLIFTVGPPSILVGKLANVMLGSVTVFATARLAGRLWGGEMQKRAAWLAALAPTLVWWSAPLMKEALATMLLVLGLLALTYFPRRGALVGFAVTLGALMLVRSAAGMALIAGAAVATALAGRRAEGRWLSRPLIVFVTVLVGGLLAAGLVLSRGRLSAIWVQYDEAFHRMVDTYQGGNFARAPLDAAKSMVTPFPWVFDEGTRNWDRGLYPGMWVLFCAYPLAALGAWRLRRRPDIGVLLAPVAAVVVANAITSGFAFRQRSMAEPLILLLALAGAPSWQVAGRYAAATLGVVAVAAGVQSRSPAVALVIALAAAAVFLVTRRRPARAFPALPESSLVAAFRTRGDPALPAGAAGSSEPG